MKRSEIIRSMVGIHSEISIKYLTAVHLERVHHSQLEIPTVSLNIIKKEHDRCTFKHARLL